MRFPVCALPGMPARYEEYIALIQFKDQRLLLALIIHVSKGDIMLPRFTE